MPKISELPEEATPTSNDVSPLVDLDGVVTKKITLANLAAGIATFFASGAINGSKLTDGTVTPSKRSDSSAYAQVLTDQATTSTTFTDLGTSGPAVTVTIGANGKARVTFSCDFYNTTTNQRGSMAVALSGANTVAPSGAIGPDILRMGWPGTSTAITFSKTYTFTGLTPGSTTFTAKYLVNGNTGQFSNRILSVEPL